MSEKVIPNPSDKLLKHVVEGIDAWIATNPPEKLKADIFKRLDKSRDEIVLKLLGFDSRYGQSWELDHCNGRSGNSIAGDYLKTHQAAVVNEWLAQAKMPEMSQTLEKALTADAVDRYQYEFRKRFQEIIAAKAKQDAEELFSQISEDSTLEKYFKTIKLLMEENDSSTQPI